jgi:biopolymer transport protein ExbD
VHFETPRRQMPTINVSALVDVIFTLLIFLLLAATFTQVKALDVTLPEADAAAAADERALVVTVPGEGPLLVDGEPVADDRLVPHLRALRSDHEAVLLVADGQVALQRAVAVLDAAGKAGFTAVSIATQAGVAEGEAP